MRTVGTLVFQTFISLVPLSIHALPMVTEHAALRRVAGSGWGKTSQASGAASHPLLGRKRWREGTVLQSLAKGDGLKPEWAAQEPSVVHGAALDVMPRGIGSDIALHASLGRDVDHAVDHKSGASKAQVNLDSGALKQTMTLLSCMINIFLWVMVGIVAGFAITCVIAYSVYRIYRSLHPPSRHKAPPRTITFGGIGGRSSSRTELDKSAFCNNAVITTKYTAFGVPLFALLPLNMMEQFRKSANVYFLGMGLVLLIGEQTDLFDVSMNPYTLLVTLVILMGISVIMAGIDDWGRHRQDKETNHRWVEVLHWQEGSRLQRMWKTWQELEVGDVVLVENNKAFPADLVILASSDETDGSCYVDTANLDGETNLKSKIARKESQALIMNTGVWSALFGEQQMPALPGNSSGSVTATASCVCGEAIAEAPNNKLYTFQGSLKLSGLPAQDEVLPLDPQQLLLRGTVLRNTKWCIGVVVYTGRETRMAMNAHETPAKLANLDKTLNRVMFLVIGVQAVIAMISAFLHISLKANHEHHWYLDDPVQANQKRVLPDAVRYWLTFFTLYSNLLPISLYSTLEICNVIQSRFINNDRKMYDREGNVAAQVKSTNLCQELGQIAYLFTDKTGTLTQNVMELKRVSINGHVFGELSAGKTGFSGGLAMEKARGDDATSNAIDAFLEILAVSHTVVIDGDQYQAESPDEGALVQAAADLGWVFSSRRAAVQGCKVRGELRNYQELALNAFNSKRKRMSLVVKNALGEAWLLVKGADNVMLERASAVPKGLSDHIDDFAKQGLRTLVIGRRRIEEAELSAWLQRYEDALRSMDGRHEALEAVAESIEKDLELVGATAIEDKLQEDVDITISNLKQAGVKVWVLTGDKLDTARIIGFSCAVLSHEMDIMTLDGPETADELRIVLRDFHERVIRNAMEQRDSALMLTGQALGICLEDDTPDLRMMLLEVARPCSVLIACRVSPSQKAEIVKLVRENTSPTPVTLSIGDGANDVPMIQEAQVGVGISGKEGKQAANAADFSIGQFRFLQRLLLVHGRWNYRRTCKFILYSFYKNTVLVLTLFVYSFFCGQSGTSFYEDLVRNSFNIVLALPIICVGVFEKDVSEEVVLKYPSLYKSGRLGLDLNFKKMAEALLSALLHAVILVKVLAAAMPAMNTDGSGDYYFFGTVAFSCLITAMNYRAAFLTTTWNKFSVAAMFFGSFGLYCVFMTVYGLMPWSNMYMVPFKVASTPLFWLILIVVPLQAMAIDMLVAYLLSEFFPSEIDVLSEGDVFGLSDAKMQKRVDAINTEHDRRSAVYESSSSMKLDTFRSTGDLETPDVSARDEPFNQRQSLCASDGSRAFAFSHPDEGKPSRFGALRKQTASILQKLPTFPTLQIERWPTLATINESNGVGSSSSSRAPRDDAFLQQTLPSKHFVLTGYFVKWSLLATGVFFIFSGMFALLLSERVHQVRVQYDGTPVVPEDMTTKSFLELLFTKFTTAELPFGTHRAEIYNRDCSLGSKPTGKSRTCMFAVTVPEDMHPPIQVLYLVSPFLQNYNRYMRSVDVRQLEGQDVPHNKVKCIEGVVDASNHTLNPCGLQAQSFFNDTFEVYVGGEGKSALDSSEIVFPRQIEERWANPSGHAKGNDRTKWLHERYPGVIKREDGVKDRHFMVHMRPGALGYAQKKYGVINQPLRAGQDVKIRVNANFPVDEFYGRKFLILTTTTWLGGRNDFLGYELLFAGVWVLIAASGVALQQWLSPRELGHWRSGEGL